MTTVYPLCGCNGLFLTAYTASFLQPTRTINCYLLPLAPPASCLLPAQGDIALQLQPACKNLVVQEPASRNLAF